VYLSGEYTNLNYISRSNVKKKKKFHFALRTRRALRSIAMTLT
jgi:hypothetical protein